MLPVGFYLTGGTANEFAGMLQHRGYPIRTSLAVIGAVAVFAGSVVPMIWPLFGEPYPDDCPLGRLGWPMAAGLLSVVGLFTISILKPSSLELPVTEIAHEAFVIFYIGGCASFWIAIRQLPPGRWGLVALVGIIFVTKFSDAGAYFAGRAFGRRKLCPRVSPGKTVEGSIGGWITAIVAAYLYFGWLAQWASPSPTGLVYWWGPLAMASLLSLFGMIGDLSESLVKRDTGKKDSSRMLPGLGGIWDVTDSLLPTAVVGYLGLVAGWIR